MTETREFCAEENEKAIFKSYLRGLLRDLEDIKKGLDQEDIEKAKEKLDELLSDTQKGIED